MPVGHLPPPSNTWFPGPTRVHIPNGISIDSAVFAALTVVTYSVVAGQMTGALTSEVVADSVGHSLPAPVWSALSTV